MDVRYASLRGQLKAWRLRRRLAEAAADPPRDADVTVLARGAVNELCVPQQKLGVVIQRGCAEIRRHRAEVATDRLVRDCAERHPCMDIIGMLPIPYDTASGVADEETGLLDLMA